LNPDKVVTDMTNSGIWLAGKNVPGRGASVEIRTPFSNDLVGTVKTAGVADIDDAVQAAHACFQSKMRLMPVHERSAILSRAAVLLEKRADDIARNLVRESGKPIALARVEPRRGAEILRLAAEGARFFGGEIVPLDALAGGSHRVGLAIRTPLGVVGAISPFNAPINLSLQKLAPALATGCCVVLKPADQTPLTALMLGEIFAEAGLPEGALSIVPGPAEAGAALVSHPLTAVVSFTGSSAVAKKIQAAVGIKKVIYELGSNAPNIVCADADLDQAALALVASGFNSSGQICVSAQRIFLHEAISGAFLAKFIPLVEKLKVGDPMEPTTTIGTLIGPSSLSRIESWVAEAVGEGAKVLAGGRRHESGRNLLPTVLGNVTREMKVQCEEIFGPVVTITTFKDDAEAIRMANDSVYGLSSGVFTQNISTMFRYIRDLEVGNININDGSRFRQDNTPFCGVKESGVGREGGMYALEEYTYLKFVGIKLAG
jgi:acyl-CoA reductase-like NAD-dependent aldehyde dehydrogenase